MSEHAHGEFFFFLVFLLKEINDNDEKTETGGKVNGQREDAKAKRGQKAPCVGKRVIEQQNGKSLGALPADLPGLCGT